ncbi:MAG TPA: hydrogenase maturation protease [Candidatus Saccharimonadales bacterium]|nr:hydrogenase maturation protease [Candidatus Saccharimonadales bacterium]
MTSIILACGNALRGDDGIGLYLAHQLYGLICDAETEIVCSHQWLPEQAEDLSRARAAVFIDASVAVPAGEIRVQPVPNECAKMAGVTTHALTPNRLMSLARELFGNAPERAFLVTIGASSFEHGSEFSEPVRKAIPAALRQIQDLLFEESVRVG